MGFLFNIILKCVPVSFFRFLIKRDIMGCYFHLVSNENLSHVKNIISYKNVKRFEQDLETLLKIYDFVKYEDFKLGNYVKNKSLLLTFDDGYKELYTIIFPILKRLNIPAVFFISTDLIDNKNLFYRNSVSLLIEKLTKIDDDIWIREYQRKFEKIVGKTNICRDDAIKEIKRVNHNNKEILNDYSALFGVDLQDFLFVHEPYLTQSQIVEISKDELFTIGAHTIDHRELFKEENSCELKRQIVSSVSIIQSITNEDDIPFAFPYTSRGVSRELISEILNENDNVNFLFGEPNLDKKDKLVIHRFAFDDPSIPTMEVVKILYLSHIKDVLKSFLYKKK